MIGALQVGLLKWPQKFENHTHLCTFLASDKLTHPSEATLFDSNRCSMIQSIHDSFAPNKLNFEMCTQFVIWICFLIRFRLSYDFWSPLTVLIFVNARSYFLSLWLRVYGKRPVFHLSPIKRYSIYFDDVWNIIHLFFLGCLFNHTMFKRRETETDSFDLFVWLLSIIRKLWLADTFSRQLWPFYRLWSSSSSAFRFDQFFSWFYERQYRQP